ISNSEVPDQFTFIVSAQESRSFAIGRVLKLNGIEVFLVMPESSSLPDGGFVIYVDDALDEGIVEFRPLDDNPRFCCLSDSPAHTGLDALIPPVRKSCYWNYG